MRQGSRAGQALVLVAILAMAVNLRPAAVSVGPVLDDVRASLAMSGLAAGVLTSLPVLAFAVFGAVAARVSVTFGPHRLIAICLGAITLGLFGRAHVGDTAGFLALSLVALAGMAAANVVLPSLVKLHFPHRVGPVTALYAGALSLGLTVASVVTVPLSHGGARWRTGLEVWALVALAALVPWSALLGRDGRGSRLAVAARSPADHRSPAAVSLSAVARTRLGRRMALFFGLQSLQAYSVFGWAAAIYRDAGFSAATAGLLLGVINAVGLPLAFAVPALAGRFRDLRPLVWTLSVCSPVGYVGLVVAPHAGAFVWAVLIGVGISVFPLVLTLIGLRARTPEGTAALSGFTQGSGYLLAAVGPFGVGALHDASGGWTVPLLGLTALAVPLLLVALSLARPAYVEDELEPAGAALTGSGS